MSTQKRPSYNALLRKIERLEAALAAAHEEQQRARKIASEYMTEAVILRMRAEQAIAILKGEDA